MVKVVSLGFKQCLVHLTCCFRKGPMKADFLEIWLTTFFTVRNLGNTSAMKVIFAWKCSKFNLHFKNAEANRENVLSFRDNSIWIGCLILSLLRRKYFSSAVNMLTNIVKTFHVTKREVFSYSIAFTVINEYGKGGAVQICKVFGPP